MSSFNPQDNSHGIIIIPILEMETFYLQITWSRLKKQFASIWENVCPHRSAWPIICYLAQKIYWTSQAQALATRHKTQAQQALGDTSYEQNMRKYHKNSTKGKPVGTKRVSNPTSLRKGHLKWLLKGKQAVSRVCKKTQQWGRVHTSKCRTLRPANKHSPQTWLLVSLSVILQWLIHNRFQSGGPQVDSNL